MPLATPSIPALCFYRLPGSLGHRTSPGCPCSNAQLLGTVGALGLGKDLRLHWGWRVNLILSPQGQDGPLGDKGNDDEPGQTVSVWSDGFLVGASCVLGSL